MFGQAIFCCIGTKKLWADINVTYDVFKSFAFKINLLSRMPGFELPQSQIRIKFSLRLEIGTIWKENKLHALCNIYLLFLPIKLYLL